MNFEVAEIKGIKAVEREPGVFYKECSSCITEKPLNAFGAYKKRIVAGKELRYYRTVCQRCLYGEDPFKYEAWKSARASMKNHMMSTERWEAIFNKQGRKCGICGSQNPKSKRGWHIDHDHACCPGNKSCGKCVRGILCHSCNVGLGNFCDDVDALHAAITYLSGSQVPTQRSLETKLKIAHSWDKDRRKQQATLIRTINKRRAPKDYECPDCGKEFKQVSKQEYGGHRKTCLYWKKTAEQIQTEENKPLGEIIEAYLE